MSDGGSRRPDRHALLELDALLARIHQLAGTGDRARYDQDDEYRWVIHRLWIAVGNEAEAYAALTEVSDAEPWRALRQLRNKLAHVRLPDIDEDEVWRVTMLRTESLRAQIRQLLR
ncbi:MAG: HepT-like ribonuclease domain-containing protein [Actinomycetes bacterium]